MIICRFTQLIAYLCSGFHWHNNEHTSWMNEWKKNVNDDFFMSDMHLLFNWIACTIQFQTLSTQTYTLPQYVEHTWLINMDE